MRRQLGDFVATEVVKALQSITKVSVDGAVEVLKKAPELKLTFGPRAFRDIIVKASKEGDLAAMRRCDHCMPSHILSLQMSVSPVLHPWPA